MDSEEGTPAAERSLAVPLTPSAPPLPAGFSEAALRADTAQRAAAEAAANEKAVGILAAHFQTAITEALAGGARMLMACGVARSMIDDAMQLGLAGVAIGTWQERERVRTGGPVSPKVAAKRMAEHVVPAKRSPNPSGGHKPH